MFVFPVCLLCLLPLVSELLSRVWLSTDLAHLCAITHRAQYNSPSSSPTHSPIIPLSECGNSPSHLGSIVKETDHLLLMLWEKYSHVSLLA